MIALLLASALLVTDKEVSFAGSQGLVLNGTLSLPEGPAGKRFPAVLLLPGSGPTDRNGNQPPALIVDTLKFLAEGLTARGYATLRFDKRSAHVHSKDWPSQLDTLNEFFGWDRFVGDATAAFEFLAARPEVDPAKVVVLGHSEGGIIALQAAPSLKAAAFVLVGTPGRPLKAVIHEQIAAALKSQGANDGQTRFFLDRCDALCDEFIRDGRATSDIPPGLAALFPASAARYLQAVLGLDPSALAKKVKGPVLVFNGMADLQVNYERDGAALFQAAKTRIGESTASIEMLATSHNLKTPTLADSAGFQGPLVPQAVPTIADWLDKVVGL